jgi:hypothetical protein
MKHRTPQGGDLYPSRLAGIEGSQFISRQYPCVEAGSNTSTVTLRVVGGDEKGSVKSETVKYGRGSQGTSTQERLRWQRPEAYTKDRPVLTSERAPHKYRAVIVKDKYKSGRDPRMGALFQDKLPD